ncbi:MAG: phage portal protein [bacterium]
MGLLERVAAERKSWSVTLGGGQGFSEPPFWSLDRFRAGFLNNLTPERERIENDFDGYIEGAYKRDGIVFTCVLVRQLVFSEARFLWRQFRDGRPGRLFGNRELGLLEVPWPGGTTGELLARMEVDLSLAGNFYATVTDDRGRAGRAATGAGRRVSVLRPDWVTIVVGSASGDPRAADARPVGYLYEPPPDGQGAQAGPLVLMPDEVCHYSTIPDPAARFRGMSWLTPILREIAGDRAATTHKLKFFENGATLNTVVSLDKDVGVDAFDEFRARFAEQHQGTDKAYKTLFLGGGADVTVVGTDLRQLDFKASQGATESRIAAASGVGAVVAQFSEGMQGSSLNAGNYKAARRRVADALFRPLWRIAAASLQRLVVPPAGATLWYDDRDIAFLREDERDAAEIRQADALTLRNLVDAGYDPNAAVAYVLSDDLGELTDRHSGLFSVQLQPPGQQQEEVPSVSPNGNGDGRVLEEV